MLTMEVSGELLGGWLLARTDVVEGLSPIEMVDIKWSWDFAFFPEPRHVTAKTACLRGSVLGRP